MSNLNYYDFMKVDIRVGTIVKAEEYNMLKKPSIILEIYFGPASLRLTHLDFDNNYYPPILQ